MGVIAAAATATTLGCSIKGSTCVSVIQHDHQQPLTMPSQVMTDLTDGSMYASTDALVAT